MRIFFRFLVSAVSLMGLASIGVVHADDGRPPASPAPIDLAGASIDASTRAMQARIQDWQDDEASNRGRRAIACGLAGFELGALLGPTTSLALLDELPSLLGIDNLAGPAEPLNGPLSELAAQVALTADEQQQLARLQSRPARDLSDRIRLYVDTEEFLIRVTERLYQDQIDEHLGRTTGVLGFFRADGEYCAAYSLGAERDEQLTKAANRVLAFYQFLRTELAN